MSAPIDTPRQARIALNKMEAWFRKNPDRFTATDRAVLEALFELAHTPLHARTMKEELARRSRPRQAPPRRAERRAHRPGGG